MFERFTDRARRVIVLTTESARELHHTSISPKHVLLALVVEGEGVAAQALTRLGVTTHVVRALLEQLGPADDRPAGGHIPFDPRAKRILELALRESLRLGHNVIGTEHLLLGLICEEQDTNGSDTKLADLAEWRQSVLEILAAGGPPLPSAPWAIRPADPRYDPSLDWIPGEPDHKYWWGQVPFRARHRDGIGSYYISNITPQPFVLCKWVDGRVELTGEVTTPPSEWTCEWHRTAPNGNIYGPVPVHTSQDLDEVKAAAVEHHRASRRELAWERYMLDNDPPEAIL